MQRTLGSMLAERPFWRRFLAVQIGVALGGCVVAITAFQLTHSNNVTWLALAAAIGLVLAVPPRRRPQRVRDGSRATVHWTSGIPTVAVLVALTLAYYLSSLQPLWEDVRRLGGSTLLMWLNLVVFRGAGHATLALVEVRRSKKTSLTQAH